LWAPLRNLVELLARTDRLAEAFTLRRAATTAPTPPPVYGEEQRRLAELVARVRRELPADAFDDAQLHGVTMTDEAVAFARAAIASALDADS
jgi:hypothetical protein